MVNVAIKKQYKKNEVIVEASFTLYFLFIATQNRSTSVYFETSRSFLRLYFPQIFSIKDTFVKHCMSWHAVVCCCYFVINVDKCCCMLLWLINVSQNKNKMLLSYKKKSSCNLAMFCFSESCSINFLCKLAEDPVEFIILYVDCLFH